MPRCDAIERLFPSVERFQEQSNRFWSHLPKKTERAFPRTSTTLDDLMSSKFVSLEKKMVLLLKFYDTQLRIKICPEREKNLLK